MNMLYTPEQLKDLPEFNDLEKALRDPLEVIRLDLSRPEPESLARVAELRNLQSLSVSLTDIRFLLPAFGQLPDLQELFLQAVKLDGFPEGILSLSNLYSLSVGNSQLSSIPDEICNLERLERLSLSQNRISAIPDNLCQLRNLRSLGLWSNELEDLPESICECHNLEWLSLGPNRLAHLPVDLGRLKSLESLDLSYNRLKNLPESVGELKKLNRIDLTRNPFESLPACLGEMARSGQTEIKIEAGKRSMFMDWSFQHGDGPPHMELDELRRLLFAPDEAREESLSALQEASMEAVAEEVFATSRRAVEITSVRPETYSVLGTSRLGGFPDLADPQLFPKTEGKNWSFLAQFNLEELHPLAPYLPPRGMLSFFVETLESFKARVLYFDGDFSTLKTVRYTADDLVDSQDDYTEQPHQVSFEQYIALPHTLPKHIDDEQVHSAYEGLFDLHEAPNHSFNGHVFTQHESPQEQAADEYKGQPDEWVPLLSLGWDSDVGFCFWDAGTLTFCIHQEDLRRWDFSRVVSSLETS